MSASIEVAVGCVVVLGILIPGLRALPWSDAEVSATEAGLAQLGRWIWALRPTFRAAPAQRSARHVLAVGEVVPVVGVVPLGGPVVSATIELGVDQRSAA